MTVLFLQNGVTPLHSAAGMGRLDCVKALLVCRETSLSVRNKVSIFVNVLWFYLCQIRVCGGGWGGICKTRNTE